MADNRTDDRESIVERDAAPDQGATDAPAGAQGGDPAAAPEYHVYRGSARDDLARPDGPGDEAQSAAAGVPSAASAEHERLVAERAARREARLAALAPKPAPDPALAHPRRATSADGGAGDEAGEAVRTETVRVTTRSTDKFAGSLGLFVLRLIVAAIMGVHGLNKLLNLPAATATLQNTILPAPEILAIVTGVAEMAIAIALVFGLLTRVAGLGVLLVAGGALAFVLWGPWSPFQPGLAGFTGELELLLAGVGLLFLLLGGGGWSVDHGFRSRRDNDARGNA